MSEVELKLVVDNTDEAVLEPTYVNSSFSKLLPTLQLAIDSTSLGEFKQCPRRYYYTIICGYVPPGTNVHLRFGIELHSALELYEHNRAYGMEHEEALIKSVRLALASTWDKETKRPWISEDPNKNRETLIRSIIDYLDHFKEDSLKTFILANGKAAVELSFRLELDKKTTTTKVECPICFGNTTVPDTDSEYRCVHGHDLCSNTYPSPNCPYCEPTKEILCSNCHGSGEVGETYLLCGHFDRLAELQGHLWIPDVKTTKKTLNSAYFAQYSPDNQVSLYSYAGKLVFNEEIKGVIINAIQILVDETKFDRREIKRTDSQLSEWIFDAEYYISLMEVAAERNYWPMNDKACGQVYENPDTGELSYSCPFRKVCGAPPEIRETLLKLNYDKRIWDPLKTREK